MHDPERVPRSVSVIPFENDAPTAKPSTVSINAEKNLPYRRLFRAIVFNAVQDLFRKRPKYAQRDAIKWLFSDGDKAYREHICELAGFELDAWKEDIITMIEQMRYMKPHEKRVMTEKMVEIFTRHCDD